MEELKTLLTILNIITSFGTICILLHTLKKYLSSPHDTLEERIIALEQRQTATEHLTEELSRIGDKRYLEQNDANKMFKLVMISFIDFAVANCQQNHYEYTDDLMRAKQTLQEYLAKN